MLLTLECLRLGDLMNFLLVSSEWFAAPSVWSCTTWGHPNRKPVLTWGEGVIGSSYRMNLIWTSLALGTPHQQRYEINAS